MKTIYFIRHGKSNWEDPQLSDMERPLKKRGRRDAVIMGKILQQRGIKPQQVLCSPAERAKSTAVILAEETGFDARKIEINKMLYFEGVEGVIEVIHALNDQSDNVFIIGHNPEITELANHYSEKAIDHVPTCGVAGVEFDALAWSEVSLRNGRMRCVDFPFRHR